jgi:hypothetical protein
MHYDDTRQEKNVALLASYARLFAQLRLLPLSPRREPMVADGLQDMIVSLNSCLS